MDPVLSAKWQQNTQLSVRAFFYAETLNAHDKGIIPIFSAFTILVLSFYWHKQETKNTFR